MVCDWFVEELWPIYINRKFGDKRLTWHLPHPIKSMGPGICIYIYHRFMRNHVGKRTRLVPWDPVIRWGLDLQPSRGDDQLLHAAASLAEKRRRGKLSWYTPDKKKLMAKKREQSPVLQRTTIWSKPASFCSMLVFRECIAWELIRASNWTNWTSRCLCDMVK